MHPRQLLAFISAARGANITHVIASGVDAGGFGLIFQRFFETYAVDMKFLTAVQEELDRRGIYHFEGDENVVVPLIIDLISKSNMRAGRSRIALVLDWRQDSQAVELWERVKDNVWMTMINHIEPDSPQRRFIEEIVARDPSDVFFTDSECYRLALRHVDESLCEEQAKTYERRHEEKNSSWHPDAAAAAIILPDRSRNTGRNGTLMPILVSSPTSTSHPVASSTVTHDESKRANNSNFGYAYFFSTRPVSVMQTSPVSKYALYNALRELLTSIFSLRKFTQEDINVLVPTLDDLSLISKCLTSLGARIRRTNATKGRMGYDSRKLCLSKITTKFCFWILIQ